MRYTLRWRPGTSVQTASFRSLSLTAAVGLTGTLGLIGSAAAAPKAEKLGEAKALVQEALHAEVFGNDERRSELLDKATELAPTLDEPKWHAGQVRLGNKWANIDDVPGLTAGDRRLTWYETRRASARDTVEDQMALADWCASQNLTEQERAHLTRVLTLAPDHPIARTKLGFLRTGSGWTSAEELRKVRVSEAADTASISKYGKDFEKLATDLRGDNKLRWEKAKAKIAAIRDADAIPAMERILSPVNEETALLVVTTIGQMVSPRAAESLARHAILSQSANVRAQAASELKNYDMEEFVPNLLATMTDPIQSRAQVVNGGNGRLFYRHLLAQEGQDSRNVLVMDTQYDRLIDTPIGRRQSIVEMMTDAARQRATTEAVVATSNAVTKEVNERIGMTLTTVSGENLQTPADWWQWWNDYNEVFQTGEKQNRFARQTRQITVADQGSLLALEAAAGAQGGLQAYDCLAAGTPVWTNRGTQAIETLAVGDLVLSQNVTTGELAYKPVLRTTIRPESRLVRITANGKEILASGGHPMWVSGEGWVKARNLTSGQSLHSPTGPVMIDEVEMTDPQVTYNLVVGDFNTYFVGDARVLNHDNTVAEPTTAVVPGLSAR